MVNETQTLTISEFVKARLADYQEAAEGMPSESERRFVLEDIMSKRAIVDHVEDWLKGIPDAGTYEAAETVLRLLAAPYRTHPDYREEWA